MLLDSASLSLCDAPWNVHCPCFCVVYSAFHFVNFLLWLQNLPAMGDVGGDSQDLVEEIASDSLSYQLNGTL